MAASEAGFVIENKESEVSYAVTEKYAQEESKQSIVSNLTAEIACSQVITYEKNVPEK